MTERPGIFAGLKVIDCASFIAAPAAATVLSDFGADVIKIEPPGGDPYRQLVTMPGYPRSEHNYAWMLESRNKRSIVIDLTTDEGRDVVRRLAARADVFITNYPPAVRRKLGLTYDEIGPLSDRLIYASFTGYGESGPEADKPGFDSNAWWARSGLMDIIRTEGAAEPARSVPGMGDHPSAMAFFGAIVTALYRREKTGRGGQVGTSLIANGVWSNGIFAQAALLGLKVEPRLPRAHALNAVTNHYRTKDGRWLILSLLSEERQWPDLTRALGRPELAEDPLFATQRSRRANARALVALFDEVFATRDLAEWRRALDAAGLIFGVVASIDDIPGDEQMRAAGVVVPMAVEGFQTIGSPLWLDGERKVTPAMAPALGEHTDEILREAGLDDKAVKRLRKSGAVA
jgi:crotonobetainyl-CoA:carnitine CoA-transferase CaiB-like acyl-CoA transferase